MSETAKMILKALNSQKGASMTLDDLASITGLNALLIHLETSNLVISKHITVRSSLTCRRYSIRD